MSESLLEFDRWAPGITQASIPANNNARRNEALAGSVISATTTAQPGAPAELDIYIIPAAATGAQWSTFDEGDIAIYYNATWTAFAPYEGLRKFVQDEGVDWQYTSGWAVAASGAQFGSVGVQYAADTGSTADSDPGAGLLKWNHATQASATFLYLDDDSADGVSLTAWWAGLDPGGFCYLQHATDQDTWQIWDITAVTDATGYVKLAVALLANGGSFADGDPMLVTLEQGAGAGAVSSVNGDTGVVIVPVPITVACSDETSNLTIGTAKVTFRMPCAMTLTAVRASLSVAQTAGSIFTVDINEAGASILSTKLTIDNSEKTSTTAATPAVISDASLADDAEITIDIDQVGTALAKGLKVSLIGYPT